MSVEKMKLSTKTQESDIHAISRKHESTENSEDEKSDKKMVLSKNSATVIDIVSNILNSDEISDTIEIIEKSISEKDQNLHKGEVQTKDQKRKAKSCQKMAKKTVNEFRTVKSMLSEMRKNNQALDKKLSLEKMCQLLEKMSLQDSDAGELSYISALRELALERDIIIKKLQKLKRKSYMSEGEIIAKVTIMSFYGFEKILKFLGIFIKRFLQRGKK
ncbi:uncharacterized protein LOC117177411 [Belonocnema kinseyi]|uniref:uncharacterized protein LOC117177411 n=1 Tax=Belonocnema kinseyi TaxID=2817044 RepID=UPI00143CC197|nr:uncharacterized protein LOC117177411 [Belonocnema kinseyi]